LERKDAHPNQVRAVNALKALSDNDFHSEKADSLRGPVSTPTASGFLAG
jgi:hypothetical protein